MMSGLILTVVVLIIYSILLISNAKKNKLKNSLLFFITLFLFGVYISIVMEITGPGNILDIPKNIHPTFIWMPFNDIIFGHNLARSIFEFVANIILFMPLGVFLPLLWTRYEKLSVTVMTGFIFSVMIELFQLLNYRHTDLNDIATNTFGALIGYYIYIKFFKSKAAKFKLKSNKAISSKSKYIGNYLIAIIFILYFLLVPFADKLLFKFL